MNGEEIRRQFLLGVQTGAIVRAIRGNRSIAETVVIMACLIPKDVLMDANEEIDVPELVFEFLDYAFGDPRNREMPEWLPEDCRF